MREILFKAKRLDNGKWVEGYYCKTTIGNDVRPSNVIFVPFKVSRNEEWGWMKVDSDTICQYTGLTDKNGKKIWENDIVRDKTDDIFRIYWSEQLLNYSTKCIKSTFSVFIDQKWDLGTLFKSQIDVKVCGNIFDNADLLEVEE